MKKKKRRPLWLSMTQEEFEAWEKNVTASAHDELLCREFSKHIGWELRMRFAATPPLVFKITGIDFNLKMVETDYGNFAVDLCELTGRVYDENSNRKFQ